MVRAEPPKKGFVYKQVASTMVRSENIFRFCLCTGKLGQRSVRAASRLSRAARGPVGNGQAGPGEQGRVILGGIRVA